VTGAASGIGLAIAQALAAGGARVTLADMDAEHGQAEAAKLPNARFVAADLTQPGACRQLVEGTIAASGTLDILVNNAGVQFVAPITEFPEAKWRQLTELMLTAPFLLTQAALPGMYARGWGRLVHISSAHGRRASPFKAAYVSAKHGLEGLSKVLALEGAERGVTSNCINPGYVRTPLVQAQIADQAAAHHLPPDAVVREVMLASSPVKRLIEPEEVAGAVSYLCGPGTDSITGSDLVMDGGWGAR
jgi:3-hydroxybutyrate dehydrogenase